MRWLEGGFPGNFRFLVVPFALPSAKCLIPAGRQSQTPYGVRKSKCLSFFCIYIQASWVEGINSKEVVYTRVWWPTYCGRNRLECIVRKVRRVSACGGLICIGLLELWEEWTADDWRGVIWITGAMLIAVSEIVGHVDYFIYIYGLCSLGRWENMTR